jgi:hypothetical protein
VTISAFKRLNRIPTKIISAVVAIAAVFLVITLTASAAIPTVIMPSDTGTLTLSTCYPFNNIGTTTDAYIVTAELIESAR